MITEVMQTAKAKVLFAGLITIVIGFALWFLLAEPKVAVKIYLHVESGNYIYCETGELNDEFHTYEGEGKIAESKAVAC